MLLSVLTDNQEEFDRTWQWTKTYVQVRGDRLFAWVWNKGSVADMHSASDAIRVPFRIALDYLWFGEKLALAYLSGNC